jgi:hypothetical protein
MLIFFFNSEGIVHKEFVPPGSSWKTQEKVARVWLGIARIWMLHHDNAPCHMAVSINKSSADKSIPVVLQAHIQQISVPVTYFHFPSSKTTWKGAILVLWIISRRA